MGVEVTIEISCIEQVFDRARTLPEEVGNTKAEACHRAAWIVIAEEKFMEAFTERKEAATKEPIHTINIVGSIKVQRIEVKPKDSFGGDYKLELKAFMVTMA